MRSIIVVLLAAMLALGLAAPAPAPASANRAARATLTPAPYPAPRVAEEPAPAGVREIRLVMQWTDDRTVRVVWAGPPAATLWRATGLRRSAWLTSDQGVYLMGPGDDAYKPIPGEPIEIRTDGGLVLVRVPVPERPITPRAILPLVARP